MCCTVLALHESQDINLYLKPLRQLIEDGGQWLLLQLNPSWPNRVSPLTKEDAILGTVIAKVQTFN